MPAEDLSTTKTLTSPFSKDKTVAIVGYGSQGHAHAQNLRESGVQRNRRPNWPARPTTTWPSKHKLPARSRRSTPPRNRPISSPSSCPMKSRPTIFRAMTFVRDNLKPGDTLVCSHGFNVHFNQFEIPKGVATILVAPKGPGHLVRAEFVKGGGVPCLIALGPNADDNSRKLGLAYAKGIGGTRAGVIETTFAEETETDLFGEQVVLCGGITALIKAGYETLVEAGYQPEMAYFECMHEVKLIVDLLYQGGMNYMRYSISNTAEYGDYTRGPRIITDETKAEMRKILKEIQTGEFAREWILENKANAPAFKAMRRLEREHPIEEVGLRLRRLMTWINAKEV